MYISTVKLNVDVFCAKNRIWKAALNLSVFKFVYYTNTYLYDFNLWKNCINQLWLVDNKHW